ncbi:MAG: NAD(P)-binding protein, partial [Actinobacteria bacterium]|nr:NAD(P)-binding protein [Actinomycetota bacterium]
MAESESTRPSLRLIAGELVTSLAQDVVEIAEVALTGRRPTDEEPADSAPMKTSPPRRKPRIAIIGGGISGLSAAWSLVKDRKVDAHITVFESSGAVGGKLQLLELEG